jgi:nicotinamidase/pyrazinamidase
MISLNPKTDALIVVDAQPTFMPGGGLPVPEGDQIVPVILNLVKLFPKEMRFATKDRHPRGHISLASSYMGLGEYSSLTYDMVKNWAPDNHLIAPHAKFTLAELQSYLHNVGHQTLWPDHAIEGTEEAELHPLLPESLFTHTQVKGMDPRCDSYSGYFDNLRRATGLGPIIWAGGITRAFYCGLARDFCVGFTGLEGLDYGIEAYVITDATRATSVPGANETMDQQFRERGVRLVTSDSLAA